MDDVFQETIRKIREAEYELLERVLEQSIQGGKNGVLVIRDQMGILMSAEVHDEVPYGLVHEMRVQVDRSDDLHGN